MTIKISYAWFLTISVLLAITNIIGITSVSWWLVLAALFFPFILVALFVASCLCFAVIGALTAVILDTLKLK